MRHLTYANVMATVAVFIALGAGAYAAVNLPPNSVKSRQIAPGQVKRSDLAPTVRPIPFSYSKPIGTLQQSKIANSAGYRILASCPEVSSNRPALSAAIVVPKDGTLDSLQAQTTDGTPADAGLGRVPIEGGVPESLTGAPGAFAPIVGEVAIASAVLTYSAPGRGALIPITIRSNDENNRCEVTGAIIPLG